MRRDNSSTTDIPEGARHAGEVTRFIFDDVVPRNPQITRVYIYHWNSVVADGHVGLGARSPPADASAARCPCSRAWCATARGRWAASADRAR